MTTPDYKDERFCDHCQQDTEHTCRDSEHERDASDDYQECLRCGWYETGFQRGYQEPLTGIDDAILDRQERGRIAHRDQARARWQERVDAAHALTELTDELKTGRQPDLAWTVRWAVDGRIDRVWAASDDPNAMRVVLGDPKIGLVVPEKNLLGKRFSPTTNAGLLVLAASFVDLLLNRTRLPLTAYAIPYAFNAAQRDRADNVARIRAAWRGELPTLQELFRRHGIGVSR